MKSLVVITTTFARLEDARKMADLLLDKRLIACAQLSSPITSLYLWKGKNVEDTEYVLTMKTTAECATTVKESVAQNHPYEVPQIVLYSVADVHPPYLDWVYEEVAP